MSEGADGTAQRFYGGLGPWYDRITRTQRYEIWGDLYADLIERHRAPGKRLLDVGCGTGRSSLELARHGFEVTGVDLSPEMLDVARGKEGADAVTFIAADVRDLPDFGSFDVVTTMGEPFTYLADNREMAEAFRGVARALVPDGTFLFDLPTAGFYDRLAERKVIDDGEDAVSLWRGVPSSAGPHAVDLIVDVFTADRDGGWRRLHETTTLYYFAPEQVMRLLRGAGFSVESVYGLYKGELQPEADQELHRKYLVAARKTASEDVLG
ncbi:class I SAM-dependent methyltransferase [Streptomyces sp. NPDC002755]